MTTPNDARKAVYDRFIAMWPGLSSDTAYTFENEKFTPPDGDAWVRLSVRNLQRRQDCLGSVGHRRFKSDALVFMQVFTPGDQGLAESDALVLAAQGIFDAVSFGGLDFRAMSSREVGVNDGQHMTLVEAPFDYEETK